MVRMPSLSNRHGLVPANATYDEVRKLFERALAGVVPKPRKPEADCGAAAHTPSPMSRAKRSTRAQAYNEMHGLMVGVGKQFCLKSKACCEGCPLEQFLPRPKSGHRGL